MRGAVVKTCPRQHSPRRAKHTGDPHTGRDAQPWSAHRVTLEPEHVRQLRLRCTML